MPKAKVTVTCIFSDSQTDVREILRQSFRLYLRNALAQKKV